MSNNNNNNIYNNSVLKFFILCLNEEINNNNNSCVLDLCNIFILLKLIIRDNIQIPEFIIKLLFKNLRCCVLIRKGYTFNPVFFKSFSECNILLDYIPTNAVELKKINRRARTKFSYWPHFRQFIPLDFLSTFTTIPLYIRNESYFDGRWETSFETIESSSPFFVDVNQPPLYNIPKMRGYGIKNLRVRQDPNCLFLAIPYKNINSALIIVMPHKPHTKCELIKFCKNRLTIDDIINFYVNNCFLLFSGDVYLPKFEIEYSLTLNKNAHLRNTLAQVNVTSYISQDLKSIVPTSFNINSKINVNEIGTTTTTKYLFSCQQQQQHSINYGGGLRNVIDINKNFLFFIINNTNDNNSPIITKIGLFVGSSKYERK